LSPYMFAFISPLHSTPFPHSSQCKMRHMSVKAQLSSRTRSLIFRNRINLEDLQPTISMCMANKCYCEPSVNLVRQFPLHTIQPTMLKYLCTFAQSMTNKAKSTTISTAHLHAVPPFGPPPPYQSALSHMLHKRTKDQSLAAAFAKKIRSMIMRCTLQLVPLAIAARCL
jgi:hypothetical protein